MIEHIEDDLGAVASMARMLRPDGLMILTVPAFERLWDHHNDIGHHVRRYTASRRRSVIEGLGVDVLELRYAFRALFLPKLLVRLVNSGGPASSPSMGSPPPRSTT